MKNRRASALLLALALLLCLAPQVFALDAGDTIRIRTAEDLAALAEQCSLDTWSSGRTVILEADVSLSGVDFDPIPFFNGTFEGGGHTINGLNLSASISPAGLFAVVGADGVIRDLCVTGSVSVSGAKESIGGIAGVNRGELRDCRFSGIVQGSSNVGGIVGTNEPGGCVSGCSMSGFVSGESMTGGIVGSSYGTLSGCTNSGDVNTTVADPSMSLEDIKLSVTLDLSALSTTEDLPASTDSGGIAGYSTGSILCCTNVGTVGYPHVGYNVGGVAGRSSGYLYGCSNTGAVCGRKDVGGIAGQMEPYIIVDLTEDAMARLEEQLDTLSGLVNGALDDVDSASGSATSRLNNLASYLDAAASAAGNIRADVDLSGAASAIEDIRSAYEQGDIEAALDPDAISELYSNAQFGFGNTLSGLTSAISGMSGQLHALSNESNGTTGVLTDDMRAINEQFNAISTTFFGAVLGVQTYSLGDTVADTSDADVDAVRLGKAQSCTNDGPVEGDINVGGVTGSLAIEYSLDPEDDVTENLGLDYKREYELKAVVDACVNRGSVASKKDCAGCICGRVDLGTVVDCLAYGRAESESGDYVGGVAGCCSSNVRGCWAKCSLAGGSYIGGIVGSGVTDGAADSTSSVQNCYSLVRIDRSEQFTGAIAGFYAGEFIGNRFVSDELAGVDRLSYAGQAEPIRYAALLYTAGLPDEFRSFTLRFVVDGETVASHVFEYGDSFDDSVFPALPEKEGFYGAWDVQSLRHLHFDTTVTAVYTPCVTALAGDAARPDGRPVFFAEGRFAGGDRLSAAPEEPSPAAFPALSHTLAEALHKYFSFVERRVMPDMEISLDVLEQWSVQIPDDGLASHTLRYRPPDSAPNGLDVYERRGGVWQKLETESSGSYLLFDVAGGDAEIAVLSTMPVWWLWALAAALVLLLLWLLVRLLCGLVRKRAARRARRREQIAALLRPAESETNGKPENDEPANDADDEPDRTAEAGPAPVKRRRRSRRALLCVLAALLLVAGALAYALFSPALRPRTEAVWLLWQLSAQKETDLALHIDADTGDESLTTDAAIFFTDAGGRRVSCVEQYGVPFYFSGDTIYLENGSAYRIGGLVPDYSRLAADVIGLFRSMDVAKTTEAGAAVYAVTADGTGMEELLSLLLPSVSEQLSSIGSLDVCIYTDGDGIRSFVFSGSGTRADGAACDIRAELLVGRQQQTAHTIPQAVADAMADGAAQGELEISEDFLRLLAAAASLCGSDALEADVRITADCGPLVLNDAFTLTRRSVDGTAVNCLRSSLLTLYFTNEAICGENGRAVPDEDAAAVRCADLLDVAYGICLENRAVCTADGDAYTYSFTLTGDELRDAARAAAPGSADLDVSFTDGQLTLTVENDRVTALGFRCGGSVTIGIIDADVSIADSMSFRTPETETELPERVVETLLG